MLVLADGLSLAWCLQNSRRNALRSHRLQDSHQPASLTVTCRRLAEEDADVAIEWHARRRMADEWCVLSQATKLVAPGDVLQTWRQSCLLRCTSPIAHQLVQRPANLNRPLIKLIGPLLWNFLASEIRDPACCNLWLGRLCLPGRDAVTSPSIIAREPHLTPSLIAIPSQSTVLVAVAVLSTFGCPRISAVQQ
jgi:hypothetical protein